MVVLSVLKAAFSMLKRISVTLVALTARSAAIQISVISVTLRQFLTAAAALSAIKVPPSISKVKLALPVSVPLANFWHSNNAYRAITNV